MIKLLKLWPILLALAVGSAAFFFGYRKGVTDMAKIPAAPCPDCVCEQPEPCPPVIDFDKIKNVRGLTMDNRQTYYLAKDSITVEVLMQEFRKELERIRLARCR